MRHMGLIRAFILFVHCTVVWVGASSALGKSVATASVPAGLMPTEWQAIAAQLPYTPTNDFGQQTYLKASNTGASDKFGYSVAVNGDTIVVGAPSEASSAIGVNGDGSKNDAPYAGAVYVFVRDWRGTVQQQAYLKASNTEENDGFGYSVAVSGDTIVVGAPFERSSATGVNGDESKNDAIWAGAAYVFVRNDTTWSQQAYLKASNTGSGDQFGRNIAIDGNTVVVGAVGEDSLATGLNGSQLDDSALSAGAAYVFGRNDTTWSQQAYIKASNTDAGDMFGVSVALSGDTIVVGATGESSSALGVNGDQISNLLPNAGAAYVFVYNGTTWSQQAYLKASNTDAYDVFGGSVALSADTIVVGAMGESSSATGLNGDQTSDVASSAGAVYVFERDVVGQWSQQAYLKASNTGYGDFFGAVVAVDGDTVVVGAYNEDSNALGVNNDQSNNDAVSAGAAYVFVRSDTVWSQQAYLKASNTDAYDEFGFGVAVSRDTIVISAPYESSGSTGVNGNQTNNIASEAGAAYLFAIPLRSIYLPLVLR